jgi:hypothetical protein
LCWFDSQLHQVAAADRVHRQQDEVEETIIQLLFNGAAGSTSLLTSVKPRNICNLSMISSVQWLCQQTNFFQF